MTFHDALDRRLVRQMPVEKNGALAERLSRSTFKVWRNGISGCVPMACHGAHIADIEAILSDEAFHKFVFIVLETDTVSQRKTQHIYTVRKGSWQGRFNDRGVKQYPYHADCLASMGVNAFEPAERWQWTPGADVVGQPDFIELQSQGSE